MLKLKIHLAFSLQGIISYEKKIILNEIDEKYGKLLYYINTEKLYVNIFKNYILIFYLYEKVFNFLM